MALSGFKAQNHPQQTRRRGANPEVDDRATPPEMFEPLHARFRFTLDVAASGYNAKLPRYFTAEDDGLAQSWAGERVWCNPPYSDIRPWVEKFRREAFTSDLMVMLLPANRTEQKWWQELVEPYRDRGGATRVEFLPGRPRFICVGESAVLPNQRPPFGCCLLIWQREAVGVSPAHPTGALFLSGVAGRVFASTSIISRPSRGGTVGTVSDE